MFTVALLPHTAAFLTRGVWQVNVFDTDERVSFIEKPPHSPPSTVCPCHIYWENDQVRWLFGVVGLLYCALTTHLDRLCWLAGLTRCELFSSRRVHLPTAVERAVAGQSSATSVARTRARRARFDPPYRAFALHHPLLSPLRHRAAACNAASTRARGAGAAPGTTRERRPRNDE